MHPTGYKMKKIIYFVLMCSAINCTKDDKESSMAEISILGKWYHKEVIVNNTVFPYDDHEICGKDFIEFYDIDKIRSVDIWSCAEDVNWIGTFTKINNILKIQNGSEQRIVEIETLNESTLSYKCKYDSNNDGILENHVETFNR